MALVNILRYVRKRKKTLVFGTRLIYSSNINSSLSRRLCHDQMLANFVFFESSIHCTGAAGSTLFVDSSLVIGGRSSASGSFDIGGGGAVIILAVSD
jgi:hypothetical protein